MGGLKPAHTSPGLFFGFFGTTEVVPFQNSAAMGVFQQPLKSGPFPEAFMFR
jgi:hypothetical protein